MSFYSIGVGRQILHDGRCIQAAAVDSRGNHEGRRRRRGSVRLPVQQMAHPEPQAGHHSVFRLLFPPAQTLGTKRYQVLFHQGGEQLGSRRPDSEGDERKISSIG